MGLFDWADPLAAFVADEDAGSEDLNDEDAMRVACAGISEMNKGKEVCANNPDFASFHYFSEVIANMLGGIS